MVYSVVLLFLFFVPGFFDFFPLICYLFPFLSLPPSLAVFVLRFSGYQDIKSLTKKPVSTPYTPEMKKYKIFIYHPRVGLRAFVHTGLVQAGTKARDFRAGLFIGHSPEGRAGGASVLFGVNGVASGAPATAAAAAVGMGPTTAAAMEKGPLTVAAAAVGRESRCCCCGERGRCCCGEGDR